jgi:hypothetical protein
VPGKPEAGEEFFRQSIADLSKRLGERAARESTSEPQAAAEARRRAMKAYERERARKLRLALMGAGAVVATAGFAWVMVLLGEPDPLPMPPSQIADVQSVPSPAPPVLSASAAPAMAPPQAAEPQPPPAAVTESQPPPSAPIQADPPPTQTAAAPPAATTPPGEPSPQAQPEPAATPRPSPLGRDEIREVQKRLRGFGFNPGPVDGVAGRQTEIAAQRYLEDRGQPQLAPTDRDFLAQLRQDPTPQVAPVQTQVAQRPGQYSGTAQGRQPQRGSFDPFQPVKYAGTEITRFFQAVFR